MSDSDFKIENHVLIKYLGNKPDILIPDSVSGIAERAFSGCDCLHSVKIPDTVTEIGTCAFSACHHLESVILPKYLHSIPECMCGCSGLNRLTLPEQITQIEEGAFYGCRNLTSVTFPESLRKIGVVAFADCGLESVVIPDTVEVIESGAFYCRTLKKITRYGMTFTIEEISDSNQILASAKLLKQYSENPASDEAAACLKKKKNFRLLFLMDNEYFIKFLNTGKYFTRRTIDKAIQLANQKHYYDKQMLLMNYKYQHFQNTGRKLKL
ncbi:MAG: leucine-rich repeat domain-containing protein [Oscillospiraceae bacterium]|nr:leucine-rich repeat domain-containing protein [Oscillospiraceae bacterium]